MNPDDLRKIAAIIGKPLSEVSPDNQKLLSDFVSSLSSNASASSGERMNLPATPATAGEKVNLSAATKNPELRAKEDALREKLIDAGLSRLSGEKPDRGRGTFLFNPITNQLKRSSTSGGLGNSYDLSGNLKETGPGSPDDLRADRLSRMKEGSAGAAAEQERRQGIRDSVALVTPFAPYPDGSVRPALEGRDIFRDKEGRIEDPAALKARLIKEGSNPNDAAIAAGQRYRDMFAPPNAKKEGWGMGGMQSGVVLNTTPGFNADGASPRMDVMQQLKDARKDNLQALAEARRNNPFRKEVGVVTEVQSPDGTQLAKRVGQEDSVGVARGGIAGAIGSTVDGAGRMELTDAGRKAVENRTYTSKVDATGLTAKPGSEESLTAVAGKYGTAVGGKMNFPEALTEQQRLGQEPLSEVNQKYKDSVLANARGSALNNGKVDSTAATLMQIDPAAAAKSPIVANTPNKAKEEDPIKKGLMASNKDALGKAADEELKRRQTTKQRS